PAEAGLANPRRDHARADRGARTARGAGGGAAQARARELPARRARRGRRRRVGRRRGPGLGPRLPRRRRHPGVAAGSPRSPHSPRSPRSLRRHAAVSRAPRIYISAGEPSGDAHAAAVVTALKRRLPGATVEAFGGPDLEAAGAAVLDRMEQFSVVGFVDAPWKLPAHLRLLRRVRPGVQARRYAMRRPGSSPRAPTSRSSSPVRRAVATLPPVPPACTWRIRSPCSRPPTPVSASRGRPPSRRRSLACPW